MFKLRRFLKNYKKELILGPFFKLLEAIFELIVPLVMADIIDTGIKKRRLGICLENERFNSAFRYWRTGLCVNLPVFCSQMCVWFRYRAQELSL